MRSSVITISIALLLSCNSSFLYSQNNIYDSGGPLLPEQKAYDVTYYDLSLTLDFDKKWIGGSLEMTCRILNPLDKVVLHLDTLLKVGSTEINGQSVKWEHKDGLLVAEAGRILKPGETVRTLVNYSGHPKEAPNPRRRSWADGFFWSRTADGQSWIGNVSVLDGADIWWPCKDHPSDEADSMSLHFTVPSNLTVATNGQLKGIIENKDGTSTHNWFVSTPINNYGVTINVAPYEKIETMFTSVTGETFPFAFWFLPENEAKARAHFPNFLKDMAFMEKIAGPYPFRIDKYGTAETYYFGMETQSIIAYGSDYSLNEYGFDFLHFHELAHEWFANMVTARDWRDWWIHESFATYVESLYAEELNGENAYHRYVEDYYARIKNEYPVVLSRDHVSAREGYIGDVYSKGAAVLHTLRYLLGKENILLAVRKMAYPDESLEEEKTGRQCRFSSTLEFEEIVNSIYGKNLDWFFDAYLHFADLPVLTIEKSGNQLLLSWNTESLLPFNLPVQVMTDGQLQTVVMENEKGQIEINNSEEFEVDPYHWILKKVIER